MEDRRSATHERVAEALKATTELLARYPGLPVLIGLGLIVLNFVVQLLPSWPVVGWMAQVNLLLHLGLIVGLIGLLLIRAL
ncbi:MAG: hypothetical protein PVI59_05085 [Anaerolineae bacterium]|jgi:hypothetical protein